jgi:hypothetical protein
MNNDKGYENLMEEFEKVFENRKMRLILVIEQLERYKIFSLFKIMNNRS